MHNVESLHNRCWQEEGSRQSPHVDPTTPERKAKLLQTLKALGRSARVLDYGCGRGEFTSWLAASGYDVVGIDVSSEAIRRNQLDYPSLPFQHVPADRPTPLPNASFNAIWCSEVIEHVYDVNGIFAEFARLLQDDGLLILTTPYHGWLKNLLLITCAFDKHFDVEWQHIRFWTRTSLARVASRHDLTPVRWDSIGRIPCLAKAFFVVMKRLARETAFETLMP